MPDISAGVRSYSQIGSCRLVLWKTRTTTPLGRQQPLAPLIFPGSMQPGASHGLASSKVKGKALIVQPPLSPLSPSHSLARTFLCHTPVISHSLSLRGNPTFPKCTASSKQHRSCPVALWWRTCHIYMLNWIMHTKTLNPFLRTGHSTRYFIPVVTYQVQ